MLEYKRKLAGSDLFAEGRGEGILNDRE